MVPLLWTALALGLLYTAADAGPPGGDFCVAGGDGNIAVIAWKERSDWINVMTDVDPPARGDGKADDTAAIQRALDRIGPNPGDPKVVYLPPGNYRITRTLALTERAGGMIVGHGAATVLRWDGESGSRMFWSNGATRHSYIGMVWDGGNKAAVGIDHDSKNYYETRVLHEQMEFRNSTVAGIRVGHDQTLASAEMLFSDLKFVHNKNGALFQAWNDYNNVFDGCQFEDNEVGIRAERATSSCATRASSAAGNPTGPSPRTAIPSAASSPPDRRRSSPPCADRSRPPRCGYRTSWSRAGPIPAAPSSPTCAARSSSSTPPSTIRPTLRRRSG